MRKPKDVGEPARVGTSARSASAGNARPHLVPSKKGAQAASGLICVGALAASSFACEPELVIGTWDCAATAEGGAPGAAVDQPVTVPWTTGFEDGFCGFSAPGGFCYRNPEASYEVVGFPVHSGSSAAALRVAGDPAVDGLQARCARQGTLPPAAYYGAWFYIPEAVTSTVNWNLFHFDGESADVAHGLWDVSLALGADGVLSAYVFDFLRMTTRPATGPATVPVGAWFHLEVFWQRAADSTGRFELYVDGTLALSLDGLVTDDSSIGQWYVGNLAASITPRPSTLYVDDVTISSERQGGP